MGVSRRFVVVVLLFLFPLTLVIINMRAVMLRPPSAQPATSNLRAGQNAAPDKNWMMTLDPKTGKPYYYNTVTRETRWVRPTELGAAGTTTAGPAPTPRPTEVRPPGYYPWTVVKDPTTGSAYYYNVETRASQWVRPVELGSIRLEGEPEETPRPTTAPPTARPTTARPTTARPTTARPTARPTTARPTTARPTAPPTARPTPTPVPPSPRPSAAATAAAASPPPTPRPTEVRMIPATPDAVVEKATKRPPLPPPPPPPAPPAPGASIRRGHEARVVHEMKHDVGVVGDPSFDPRPGEHRVKALRVCTKVDSYVRGAGAVIEKHNRTLCVAPVVQLAKKLRVRLVPKAESGGKRAFFLLSQGLRAHPMVELVGSPSRFCRDGEYTLDPESPCERDLAKLGERVDADVAIFITPATDPKEYSNPKGLVAFSPYRWENNKRYAMDPIEDVGTTKGYEQIKSADENPTLFRYQPPVPRSRVIIIDESDWASSHHFVKDDKDEYLAYFKRSWVLKDRDGYPHKASSSRHKKSEAYFPMPYALADEYVDSRKLGDVAQDRPIKVVCTLRDTRGGRGRALKWLRELAAAKGWGGDEARVGQLSSAGRTVIDQGYLTTMRQAQIVVTANPTGWEGDFRLFEAMSSGALVMVDRMATPYHHPLIDGIHVIYFDHRNRTDLIAKVEHALARPRWARAVAIRGYAHVLRHHRAVSWVDYFLRSAHARVLARDGMSRGHYAETGTEILARSDEGVSHGANNGQPHLTEDQLTDDDAHDPIAVFAAHRPSV